MSSRLSTNPTTTVRPREARVTSSSALRLASMNAGLNRRSSGGYPGMASSGNATSWQPSARARSIAPRRLELIDEVDELPQAGVGRAVEGQDEPRQLGKLAELLLPGPGRQLRRSRENVVELGLELHEMRARDRTQESNHELVTDDAGGVVDAVEARDLLDGLVHGVHDPVEGHVVAVDQLPLHERPDPAVPDAPVGLWSGLDEHDGHDRRLARLREREELEALVHRAEAAREERDRARLLDEEELAREEVLERDELRVGGDPGVRLLLER